MSTTDFTVTLNDGRLAVFDPGGARLLNDELAADEVVGALEQPAPRRQSPSSSTATPDRRLSPRIMSRRSPLPHATFLPPMVDLALLTSEERLLLRPDALRGLRAATAYLREHPSPDPAVRALAAEAEAILSGLPPERML